MSLKIRIYSIFFLFLKLKTSFFNRFQFLLSFLFIFLRLLFSFFSYYLWLKKYANIGASKNILNGKQGVGNKIFWKSLLFFLKKFNQWQVVYNKLQTPKAKVNCLFFAFPEFAQNFYKAPLFLLTFFIDNQFLLSSKKF
jgi:hypothetical protein